MKEIRNMQPDEMIAIISAYKNGREIERLALTDDNPDGLLSHWIPVWPGDTFNFVSNLYRVKPLEGWACLRTKTIETGKDFTPCPQCFRFREIPSIL